MLLHIHPDNPSDRKINQVVKTLEKGGVIIYPTDTVYAMGCDINSRRAFEQICRIKGVKPNKVNFSFICYDLSHITDYTFNPNTPTYKLMKRALPGPYTFILRANNNVPKLFKSNKKTVGIRIPDNAIARSIVNLLGRPILSTSLHHEDTYLDYMSDPEEIYEAYKKTVDLVIDGGVGGLTPSTVIDCTDGKYAVLREGKGDIEI